MIYCDDDGTRFGSGPEMIEEIKKLRAEIELTKRIASIFRERLKSFGGSYMAAVREVEGLLACANARDIK